MVILKDLQTWIWVVGEPSDQEGGSKEGHQKESKKDHVDRPNKSKRPYFNYKNYGKELRSATLADI